MFLTKNLFSNRTSVSIKLNEVGWIEFGAELLSPQIVKWPWFTVDVLHQTFHSISTNPAELELIQAGNIHLKSCHHVMQFCTACSRLAQTLWEPEMSSQSVRPKERKTKLQGLEFSSCFLRKTWDSALICWQNPMTFYFNYFWDCFVFKSDRWCFCWQQCLGHGSLKQHRHCQCNKDC